MKTLHSAFAHAALAALLAISVSGLAGCGGGGGGGDLQAGAAQGLRFSVDPDSLWVVERADITRVGGSTMPYALRLSPGQEMLVTLPPGDYTIRFWYYVGGGQVMGDGDIRYATVFPEDVTVVYYP